MRTDSLFYRHRDDPDPDLSEKFFVGMYCGIPADYRVQPVLRLIMKRTSGNGGFFLCLCMKMKETPDNRLGF